MVVLANLKDVSASLRGSSHSLDTTSVPFHRRQLMEDRPEESEEPTISNYPTTSSAPSVAPTAAPSAFPSAAPSMNPSISRPPSVSSPPTGTPSMAPSRSPTETPRVKADLTPFVLTVADGTDETMLQESLEGYLITSFSEDFDVDEEDIMLNVELDPTKIPRYRKLQAAVENDDEDVTFAYIGDVTIFTEENLSQEDIQDTQTESIEDTESLEEHLADQDTPIVLAAVQVGDRPPVSTTPPGSDDEAPGKDDDKPAGDDGNDDDGGDDDDNNTGVIVGIAVGAAVVLVVVVLLATKLYKDKVPPPPPPMEDLDEAEQDIVAKSTSKSGYVAATSTSAKKSIEGEKEQKLEPTPQKNNSTRRSDVQYFEPVVSSPSATGDGAYLPPPTNIVQDGGNIPPPASSVSGASGVNAAGTFDSEDGTNRSLRSTVSGDEGDSIAGFSLATDNRSLEERRDLAEDERNNGAGMLSKNKWLSNMNEANPLPAAYRNYTSSSNAQANPNPSYISDTDTEASVDQGQDNAEATISNGSLPTVNRSNVNPITRILNGTGAANNEVTDGEDSLLDTSTDADSTKHKFFVDDASALDSDSDDNTGIYTTNTGTVFTSGSSPKRASKQPALGMFQSYESSDDEDIPIIPKRPIAPLLAPDAGSDVPSDELNDSMDQDLSGFPSTSAASPSKADAIRQGLDSYEYASPSTPANAKERKRMKKNTRKNREGRKQPPVHMEV